MEFPRQKYLDLLVSKMNNGMIKIITGMRRCGKSYLLFNLFRQFLILNGVDEKNIISVQLDELANFELHDPFRLNDFVLGQIKSSEKYYVLLDEIQLVENFEAVLNGFLHKGNIDCYVTGSNSKFLSSDIITEFRGRGDEIRVLPLTFNEFYQFKGGYKQEVIDEYLLYGGMPFCVLLPDDEQKMKYLSDLFRLVYSKDLIDRNHIKSEDDFNELSKIIASGIGSLTNPNKLSNTFMTNKKVNISPKTISSYLNYMEDAFLINKAQRYDIKGKKYISTPYKYYYSDLGVRNATIGFRQFEKTHLMENLIYNELIYRGFQVDVGVVQKDVLNEKGNGTSVNYEVDFVANKGFKRFYIQSAYSIEDEAKLQQEENSLDNINDSFEKVIVTMNGGGKAYRNEKGYLIIGVCEFLTGEDLV